MVLLADSISRRFGSQPVLASARLSAAAGEVVGLLGRMGSGKSTLLKICAGVLQPDSGWVELNGKQYPAPHRNKLASEGVFYLGESGNLSWTLTVGQHIEEIERRFGLDSSTEIVDLLNIGSLMDRMPARLSAGETKRVEFALAMVRKPLCLLADEPFRSVDPLVCEALGESLRFMARQGTAIVVTGHEVNQLMPFLDSITWVTSGTTHSLGARESALADEHFRREYLGPVIRHHAAS